MQFARKQEGEYSISFSLIKQAKTVIVYENLLKCIEKCIIY